MTGRLPRPGDRLSAAFTIPPARRAERPLTADQLRDGLVVLSTLPNIQKHACIAQVADLDEESGRRFPQMRIVHVSADAAEHWHEVEHFHPAVRAAGYSLSGADPSSLAAFIGAFGIGVRGHRRIAHGLFGLLDGVFIAVDVPGNQMRPARVEAFLSVVARTVAAHAAPRQRRSLVDSA